MGKSSIGLLSRPRVRAGRLAAALPLAVPPGRFIRACICSAILAVVASACGGRATSGTHDAGVYDCVDLFHGGTPARCCPDPPPDCTNKPDGYPGYPCVDPQNEYCSCSCGSGKWGCAC